MRLLIVTAHKQTPLFCRRLQPPHFSFVECQKSALAVRESGTQMQKTAPVKWKQLAQIKMSRCPLTDVASLKISHRQLWGVFFDLMCPSNDVLQVYGLMRSDLTGNLFRYKCPVTPWAWRVTGWTTSNATPHCLSASVSVCLFRVSCGWSVDYGRLLLL